MLLSANAASRRGNAFGHICLPPVCLPVCDAPNFESLNLRKFIFGMQVHLYNPKVKFVYQGYQDKVRVTGAKNRRPVDPHLP